MYYVTMLKKNTIRTFRHRTFFFLGVLTLVDKTNHRCCKGAEVPTSLIPKKTRHGERFCSSHIRFSPTQCSPVSKDQSYTLSYPVLLNLPCDFTINYHISFPCPPQLSHKPRQYHLLKDFTNSNNSSLYPSEHFV